jgi:hypothetical protein
MAAALGLTRKRRVCSMRLATFKTARQAEGFKHLRGFARVRSVPFPRCSLIRCGRRQKQLDTVVG